jgi:phosphoglycolate phosphatase/putative hydrolase of the HAD superfamily
MQTYSLPYTIRGLMFDMDLTLYRNEAYYASQRSNQIVLAAAELGYSTDEFERRLTEWEDAFRLAHGKSPSLGNALLGAFGYPIVRSVELRRKAARPGDYLETDARLAEVLTELSARCPLVLVTNNPRDVAERTLEVLGVRALFPRIVGLDEAGHSKPHPAAFDLGYEALGVEPSSVVAVGDRYAVDLEVPLSLGSGAVLVESMDDVYALPRVLERGLTVSKS